MLLGYSVKRFFVDNAGTLEKLTLLRESWYFCKFQLRYDEREKERKREAKKESKERKRVYQYNIIYIFIIYLKEVNYMAVGKPRQFPLEYDDCVKAIEEYKNKVEQGIIEKPSISSFLGTIGANTEEFMAVVYEPNNKNIPLSNLLKNFGAWMDGWIIATYPAPLAKFLLSQGFSGYKYTDRQELKQDTTVDINVNWGGKGKDPFA